MKFQQSTRLIATLAAIIMLQTPLCAAACLPDAAAHAAVPADQAEEADTAPCHASSNDAEVPDPRESNEDCGCEDSLQAAIPTLEKNTPANATAQFSPGHRLVPALAQPHAAYSLAPLRETDLPPPKILLLKESLLI